jgi:hypothetical protein
MSDDGLIFRRSAGDWVRFDWIDGEARLTCSKSPFSLTQREANELSRWLADSPKKSG